MATCAHPASAAPGAEAYRDVGASPNRGLVPSLWTAPRSIRDRRFMSNAEHLHLLLREKDPGFWAALELAVDRVERELSCECLETARQ
jgi:hypothetical protein